MARGHEVLPPQNRQDEQQSRSSEVPHEGYSHQTLRSAPRRASNGDQNHHDRFKQKPEERRDYDLKQQSEDELKDDRYRRGLHQARW